jgi:threonine synthase
LLARTEGLFTETAGGVAVSALEQLVASSSIASTDEAVVLITGIGLKTLEALGKPEPTHRIYPSVEEVDRIFEEPGVVQIPEKVEA